MKERGVLFSAPMVRAILDDRKMQTRRILKAPKALEFYGSDDTPAVVRYLDDGHSGPGVYIHAEEYPDEGSCFVRCPYGQPGDRLWVRETWALADVPKKRRTEAVQYRATGDIGPYLKWRPSIFMPRWASRITLEVTGIRVERLQDISEGDAKAEGVSATCDDVEGRLDARTHFCELWDSINGDLSFLANPWVWVVEFKRIPQHQTTEGRNAEIEG